MLAYDFHEPVEDRRPAPGARGGEFRRHRLTIRWVTTLKSRLELPDRFVIAETLLRQGMILPADGEAALRCSKTAAKNIVEGV
jgi:hypothetical protein